MLMRLSSFFKLSIEKRMRNSGEYLLLYSTKLLLVTLVPDFTSIGIASCSLVCHCGAGAWSLRRNRVALTAWSRCPCAAIYCGFVDNPISTRINADLNLNF